MIVWNVYKDEELELFKNKIKLHVYLSWLLFEGNRSHIFNFNK